MDYQYKIVKPDSQNSDEYLIKMFKCYIECHNYLLKIPESELYQYRIKPVNIEEISDRRGTDYDHYIRALIPNKEYKRVMLSNSSAEIHCNLLTCNSTTYYNLSQIIPKNYTVIDFGCGYNAQSYLFIEHKKYIGVDIVRDIYDENWHFEDFKAKGTELYYMKGQSFIEKELPKLNLNLDTTFAICHFVNDNNLEELIRKTFTNLFVYYPCSNEN